VPSHPASHKTLVRELPLQAHYDQRLRRRSKNQIEWILTLPGGGSLILINGVLAKSSGHPERRPEPGDHGR
jgi:hypothetical protein